MAYDASAVKAMMQGRAADFYGEHTQLKTIGGKLRGPCPIHQGDGPNFVVDAATGEWFCHTGCKEGGDVYRFMERLAGIDFPGAVEHVGQWVGASPQPSIPAISKAHPKNNVPRDISDISDKRYKVSATYDYTDEEGGLLFQVQRKEPKGFTQRKPDGQGGWVYSLGDVRRVLYRLPDVLAALAAGKPVYICEGEKDADALAALGLCATTAPMGAGKWEEAYTEALCGAGVVILPDNDEAGRDHARLVAEALQGQAKRVRVVMLPGLPEKGDVSDWLAGGGTAESLVQIVKAAPDWTPDAPSKSDAPSTKPTPDHPVPDEAMFYGLAGEIVRAFDPHTEADRVAVLFSLLAGFGVAIGRNSYCSVGTARHYGNLFGVIVGDTASGKGTSWSSVKHLLMAADAAWAGKRILTGLSSGEGLIHSVRDPLYKKEPVRDKDRAITGYQEVLADEGEDDKRLLVVEAEFGKTLTVADRDGSTLSAILRLAWDGDNLQVMTKEGKAATSPHIGIIGHITPADLKAKLTQTDAANGFANRFLWLYVRRSKLLPEGGDFGLVDMEGLGRRFAQAIEYGKRPGQVQRNEEARAVWETVYENLTTPPPSFLGAIITRGGPIVLRLSLLYALLDRSRFIRFVHLEAACALWKYAVDSAGYIFGDRLGDAVADEILHALKEAEGGLSRTDIRNQFNRHQSKRIDAALLLLSEKGLARSEKENTKGRPVERWFFVEQPATKAT